MAFEPKMNSKRYLAHSFSHLRDAVDEVIGKSNGKRGRCSICRKQCIKGLPLYGNG
jgi:hypothetical protein